MSVHLQFSTKKDCFMLQWVLSCKLFVDVELLESVSGLRHIATNQIDAYFKKPKLWRNGVSK